MSTSDDRSSARIHWLVAARFSPRPRGELFSVAAAGLDEALAGRAGAVQVRVQDRLGVGGEREFAVPVRGLRTFTLGGVIEAVPPLAALKALAARPPASAAEAAAAIEAAVGPGRLRDACAAAFEPAPPAPPATGPAAALDAFVKGAAGGAPGPAAGAARRLKEALEAAVYGTALDLLRSRELSGLEASWRGLALLLRECGKGSDIHVELLDAAPGEVAAALRARPEGDAFDEPDAVLVAEPVDSAELLSGLAALAEEAMAPCIATADPALLGAGSAPDLAARAEREEPAPPEWEAVRGEGAARWLAVAANPVALFAEGAGAYQRTAFGPAAWAVGAMLSASYRAQGAFAQLVGRPGALAAPAGWTVPEGPGKGARAPTEAFLSIGAQKALAARGVVGLGSVRDADKLVVAAAPVASSAAGALPLSAQLLTGRVVRFARWARRQMTPGMPAAEVTALFEQAAALFLFPRMPGAAALGAAVRGEGPERVLRVGARVQPSHAGVPFQIEFELPL